MSPGVKKSEMFGLSGAVFFSKLQKVGLGVICSPSVMHFLPQDPSPLSSPLAGSEVNDTEMQSMCVFSPC